MLGLLGTAHIMRGFAVLFFVLIVLLGPVWIIWGFIMQPHAEEMKKKEIADAGNAYLIKDYTERYKHNKKMAELCSMPNERAVYERRAENFLRSVNDARARRGLPPVTGEELLDPDYDPRRRRRRPAGTARPAGEGANDATRKG